MDKWYFKCRDGSYYLGAIKQDLKKITDLKDAIPHLEKMDYTICPRYWEIYKQQGNPFGRYVAWCNLKAIKCFGFKDKNLFDLE